MFTASTTILRSFVATVGAAAVTATIFYAAAGPDPRADSYLPAVQVAQGADNAAGLTA